MGALTLETRVQSVLQQTGNRWNDPWGVLMTREQGWWMARECGAVGSPMPSVWVHSATALPSMRGG